jgi:hypothetical protein
MSFLLATCDCAPDDRSEPGGGWKWARKLATRGHEVTVLTLPSSAGGIAASRRVRPVSGS